MNGEPNILIKISDPRECFQLMLHLMSFLLKISEYPRSQAVPIVDVNIKSTKTISIRQVSFWSCEGILTGLLLHRWIYIRIHIRERDINLLVSNLQEST